MKTYVNVKKKKILKDLIGVVVVHTFGPGTWEEEAGNLQVRERLSLLRECHTSRGFTEKQTKQSNLVGY